MSALTEAAPSVTHWLDSLGAGRRAAVLAVMRDLRARSDRAYEQMQALSPGADLSVGGTHIDCSVTGESLATYLRTLATGGTPAQAAVAAKDAARQIIETWKNRRPRDYVVHRSPEMVDTAIDFVRAQINRAASEAAAIADLLEQVEERGA